MAELIHRHSLRVIDKAGVTYVASVSGRPPSRDTVAYWGSGFEPTYLEGALARAQGRLP